MDALVSSLRRRVDRPFLRGTTLFDELVLCEELDGLLAEGSCCEGQDGRSLPFDLIEGIFDGLLGQSGVVWFVNGDDTCC